MDTLNMQIKSNRRCSAEELEKILADVPINICSSGKLNAYMGLGRIIYISPSEGRIKTIKVNSLSISRNNYLFFEYGDYKFDIKYN